MINSPHYRIRVGKSDGSDRVHDFDLERRAILQATNHQEHLAEAFQLKVAEEYLAVEENTCS